MIFSARSRHAARRGAAAPVHRRIQLSLDPRRSPPRGGEIGVSRLSPGTPRPLHCVRQTATTILPQARRPALQHGSESFSSYSLRPALGAVTACLGPSATAGLARRERAGLPLP
jgi:hypothetical protein